MHTLVFLFCIVVYACKEKDSPNRVYFTINPEDRKIFIPVQLNDSITANMVFDIGAIEGTFILDSTFIIETSYLLPNIQPYSGLGGIAWAEDRFLKLIYPNAFPAVQIGNTDIPFENIHITNLKKASQNEYLDGLFNIPQNDTTHVWELNFENNYLEIHTIGNFNTPENCFFYPLVLDSLNYFLQIPMQMNFADGDTLMTNNLYLIDSGMSNDIALMHPNKKETNFFSTREKSDAIWTKYSYGVNRHYNVTATLFDKFTLDSLRIYFFDEPIQKKLKYDYLIGQNFLKRFNVFFDMKNKQIGLQPIKNFQRIVNPTLRRFTYWLQRRNDGRFIVETVADYNDNPYRIAGLQEGDEFISINGINLKTITPEEDREFDEQSVLTFNILRNNQPMQLVVHIDKAKNRGD